MNRYKSSKEIEQNSNDDDDDDDDVDEEEEEEGGGGEETMKRNGSELHWPGFRFHPTEEELLEFYLRRAVSGKKLNFDIIGTLNLYLYDPWDLPGKYNLLHLSFIYLFSSSSEPILIQQLICVSFS